MFISINQTKKKEIRTASIRDNISRGASQSILTTQPKLMSSPYSLKIWSRRSVILPEFAGRSYMVYNGKTFIPLKVIDEMIGHRFGEFASTRKKAIYRGKRKK